MQKDNPFKILWVAFCLCVVCSLLVSTAAVKLRPLQRLNAKLDKQRNLLATAGLLDNPRAGAEDVQKFFAGVDPGLPKVVSQIIELESGNAVDWPEEKRESFDAHRSAQKPDEGIAISPAQDVAKIKRRSLYARSYLVFRGEELERIILPVHGKGLWSTLYGFVALNRDTRTLYGLNFYAHGETPGLGGEVDNPDWKAQWRGKRAVGEEGDIILDVLKGKVEQGHPRADSQIDGLSGATITSNGVEALVHYWLGENGFGPYLEQLRSEQALQTDATNDVSPDTLEDTP